MTEEPEPIRILAVAAVEMQDEIRRQLMSFNMDPVVVSRASELSQYARNGEVYDVLLLPATLPNREDWWAIWGELAMLTPKPAILVYAQTASFQLWSGVLEAGGYDIVVEPLTDEKLKEAVFSAAASRARLPKEDSNQE